jgi:hypothetical protein
VEEADERREQGLVHVQPWVRGLHLVDRLSADDFRRGDPEIGSDAELTEGDLATLPRRDLRSRMQRDGVPHDLEVAFAHPLLREKVLREVGSFDFEAHLHGGELRQTEVVKDGRDAQDLAVELHARPSTDRVRERGRTHDVVKQERLGRDPRVLDSGVAKLRVGQERLRA